MCVCVWEREREREYVCVFVCIFLQISVKCTYEWFYIEDKMIFFIDEVNLCDFIQIIYCCY